MSEVASVSRDPSPPPPDDRLESWKEIAAYLKRDVSTVQRWERRKVPDLPAAARQIGSVFAFKRELDTWLNRGSHRQEPAEASPRWRASAAVVLLASLVALALWAFVQGRPDNTPAVRRLSIPFCDRARRRDPEPPHARAVSRWEPTGVQARPGGLHRGAPFEVSRLVRGHTHPWHRGRDDAGFRPARWTVARLRQRPHYQACGVGRRRSDLCRRCRQSVRRHVGLGDEIIFTPLSYAGLHRVSAAGGPVTVLTTPDRQRREKSHRWPEFVPGARAVIFTTVKTDISSFDDSDIEVLSLDTGVRRTLIEGGSRARIAPGGFLVYVRGGALHAVPFDTRRLEVTGFPGASSMIYCHRIGRLTTPSHPTGPWSTCPARVANSVASSSGSTETAGSRNSAAGACLQDAVTIP